MKLFKGILMLVFASVCLISCGDDDDASPAASTLEFSGVSTVNEDDGTITFAISRTGGTGALELNYELSGTAVAGEDYVMPESTTFFVPVNGETVLEFELINDEAVENDETFIFSLIEEELEVTITILDDDTFPFENGFLVTNEGPFNNGFGSVSFVDNLFTGSQNDIYQEVNNDNLGNIVQSIGFNGNDAYVVANVSNRITIVDRLTFVESGRIESGLENPRYFEASNGKGYVSNWGDPFVATDDYVAIVDLSTNEITGTIPVGEGPERIVVDGNMVYVALRGGFGVNNQIVAIDATTDTVVTQITVGDVPESMRLDDNGELWVISQGSPAFTGNETAGSITRIDTNTQQVIAAFLFAVTEHPAYINIVGNDLFYFLDGGVFQTTVSNFTIPSVPIFTTPFLFNMFTPNNRTVLGCDAGDFNSNGALRVYDITTGEEIATLEVGIIPGNVYLN